MFKKLSHLFFFLLGILLISGPVKAEQLSILIWQINPEGKPQTAECEIKKDKCSLSLFVPLRSKDSPSNLRVDVGLTYAKKNIELEFFMDGDPLSTAGQGWGHFSVNPFQSEDESHKVNLYIPHPSIQNDPRSLRLLVIRPPNELLAELGVVVQVHH